MNLGISGRTAIVCGASKGLGRGCAAALAKEGVRVILNARDPATLERTAQEIRAHLTTQVIPVAADVTTPEGRAALLEACPNPDILVTNSGGPPELVTRMSGLGQASSSAARPSGVVTSAATGMTWVVRCARISWAVRSSVAGSRALRITRTPSFASAAAQPRPSPLLAPQTMAVRPDIPRFMVYLPTVCRRLPILPTLALFPIRECR